MQRFISFLGLLVAGVIVFVLTGVAYEKLEDKPPAVLSKWEATQERIGLNVYLITYEGHEYISVSSNPDAVNMTHSASCPHPTHD